MTKGTEKTFGYAWNIYREIIPLHKRQFEGWISPLPVFFFKDKRVLDAGCGIGRNSLWVLEAKAREVVAFDYDERTVSVARENLSSYSNCSVLFKSVYDITFRDEFDAAFCIGVLHHLAAPALALENLVASLKEGGTLIVWAYAREGNETYLKFFDPIRKYFTSKISPFIVRLISVLLTAVLRAYLILPQKKSYMKELKMRSFRHVEAMVFDQLIPSIANYWTKDELLGMFRVLPLDVESVVHTHEMSWTVVAKKRRVG